MDKKHKRLARSLCLQILFANSFLSNSFGELLDNFFKNNDTDLGKTAFTDEQIAYASKLFKSTLKNEEYVDGMIEKKLVNWEMSRLATMDRMILRMAISEMLFIDEVPPKVSIAEAVEIAKDFSSEDSSGFVNGIMDAIYNEEVDSKKISKKEN